VKSGVSFAYRQRFLPIFPISIVELNGNGRTDGLALADAGENVTGVALNLHASAAAVSLLAAPKFTVQKALIHFKPSGHARKESDKSFSM
jgi:hypothetical protein